MTKEQQVDAVEAALMGLVRQLESAGISAEIIVPVVTGWACGAAVRMYSTETVSGTLRSIADQIEVQTLDCAGSA